MLTHMAQLEGYYATVMTKCRATLPPYFEPPTPPSSPGSYASDVWSTYDELPPILSTCQFKVLYG